MPSTTNSHLIILEAEKNQTELRLREQIKSARHILDNLENKLNNNETLYDSDGLHSGGLNLDTCVTKIVVYEKSLERFRAHLNKGN